MHAIFDSSQNRPQLGRERCDGWISVKGFKWVYMPLPQKLLWVKLPTLWLITPYIMISSLRGQVNDPTRKKWKICLV